MNQNQLPTEFQDVPIEPSPSVSPQILPVTILKEIRSWAVTSLILGALHLFVSGFFSAPWGVLLMTVGLASFYVRSSAMLVVYAVTLAWAGVSNLISGESGWVGFAVLQFFLVYRVFRNFQLFRRSESALTEAELSASDLTPARAAAIFPWAALTLGVLSLVGLVGVFLLAVVLVVVSGSETVPGFLGFLEGLVVNGGVLGLALGLASLLCKHPRKGLAIAGMVTGILTLVVEMVLIYL